MTERCPYKAHGLTALLQEAGLISQEQIDAALIRQREIGCRIGETLVEMGIVSEEDLGWALARQLGLPFVDIPLDALDRELIRSFTDGLLHRLEVVPLVRMERSLTVAVADPTDGDLIDALERAAHSSVSPVVATRSAIRNALADVLGPPRELHEAAADAPQKFDVVWDRSGASFLLFHISRALKDGADELQFLPGPGGLRVLYRARGVLMQAAIVPSEMTYALLTRLSTLGGPAIDDRETHVTGQVVCPSGHEEFLVDVSLLNHDHGVAITLGLRRWNSRAPRLDELGLGRLDLARVRGHLDDPCGLILVGGPMRSGSSTTLSSLLGAIALEGRRVLTFEPRQGPVWPSGTHLVLPLERAREQWEAISLGQNADIVVLSHVLLGEHLQGALSSAGAGRLLLASTDWTDTFSMLEFLMSRPHLRTPLATRLRMVIQQRLVPSGEPGDGTAGAAGSRALFEVLHVTEPMRPLLRDGDPGGRLRALAAEDGFEPLDGQVRRLVGSGRLSARDALRLEI